MENIEEKKKKRKKIITRIEIIIGIVFILAWVACIILELVLPDNEFTN